MRWHFHLSRFLFGFSHAEHPLTGVQRAAYDKRVGELARNDRWGTLGTMLPGFVGVAAIPFWIKLQQHVPFPLQLAVQIAFGICCVIYALYLMRWKHRRHGSRALRELGLADICAKCGYDVSRQPEAEGICPECGERFSQFHLDRTVSTDPP